MKYSLNHRFQSLKKMLLWCLCIVSAGAFGGVLGFREAENIEAKQHRTEIAQTATSIKYQLGEVFQVVRNVEMLYRASETVDSEELRIAATPLMDRHPAIKDVAVFTEQRVPHQQPTDPADGLPPRIDGALGGFVGADFETNPDLTLQLYASAMGVDLESQTPHYQAFQIDGYQDAHIAVIHAFEDQEHGLDVLVRCVLLIQPSEILHVADSRKDAVVLSFDDAIWSVKPCEADASKSLCGIGVDTTFTKGDARFALSTHHNMFLTDMPLKPVLAGTIIGGLFGTICVVFARLHGIRRRFLEERSEAVEREVHEKTVELKASTMLLEQAYRESEIAAQRLRISEGQLKAQQLAVDAARTGTWDWHIPTGKVVTNSWWHEILGKEQTQDGVTIDDFEALVHPGDISEVIEAVYACHNGEVEYYDATFRMQHADGSYRWIRSIGGVIERDASGETVRMVGQHVDVTRAIKAESRLKVSEREARKLSLIVERTNSAVVLTDSFGYVVWVNHAFTEISGYRLDEVIGKKPGHVLQCESTDQETVRQIRNAVASYEPVACEILNRAKDGSEYWLALDIQPMFEDGECVGFVALETDVTERRERERMMSEARESLEQAQRVGELGSWTYDLETGHVSWSSYLYELYERDASIGPPNFEEAMACYTPSSADALQRAVDRAIETGERFTLTLETREENQTCRYIEGIGQARRDEHGKLVSLFGTARNITDQVTRERALEKAMNDARSASRAKSEFLANMSHEIRTPMTAILGYADLIEEARSEDETAEYIDTIKRNGQHLLGIINDVLDLSRIESGKLTLESIPCSPAQIVQESADLLRVRAEGKGIGLKVDVEDGVPACINGDPTRMKQVVMNLIGNAIKFTEVGSVSVRVKNANTTKDEHALRVEIEDTGPGIAPERQSAIFQTFEQEDSSMARKHGGSGLGLAICGRLAAAMDGRVTLEKSEVGKGSLFVFEFSAAAIERRGNRSTTQDRSGGRRSADGAGDAKTLEGLRVLLVEDGQDNQRLISFHLKKLGTSVEIAENGLLGVNAYKQMLEDSSPPDVILMDMQMPEMDGYTATRELRKLGATLPIIALTAHAMSGDREKCLAAGCSDYLTKPIARDTLQRAIAMAVSPDASSSREAA